MNLAILGLLMVLAALFMKRGVVGALEDLVAWIKRKFGGRS
jgi:ABC-type branched-subunit amino acid transport system permease subunit